MEKLMALRLPVANLREAAGRQCDRVHEPWRDNAVKSTSQKQAGHVRVLQ
jgi:hypothetical protein